MRCNGGWAGGDDSWIAWDVRSTETHEVGDGGRDLALGAPGADTAHDVLDESLVAAEAVGVRVTRAAGHEHPGVQAAWEEIWAIWLRCGGCWW